jgi:hypothetical protein
MKKKKDIEVLLLEHLLSGCQASQRGFGDAHGTSRLAVAKHRLIQKGFPVQTKIINFGGDVYGVYYL